VADRPPDLTAGRLREQLGDLCTPRRRCEPAVELCRVPLAEDSHALGLPDGDSACGQHRQHVLRLGASQAPQLPTSQALLDAFGLPLGLAASQALLDALGLAASQALGLAASQALLDALGLTTPYTLSNALGLAASQPLGLAGSAVLCPHCFDHGVVPRH